MGNITVCGMAFYLSGYTYGFERGLWLFIAWFNLAVAALGLLIWLARLPA